METFEKNKVLQIHHRDNVLVALRDLAKGEQVLFDHISYTMLDEVRAKHKFFMQDMKTGDEVIMYGVLVGKAQHPVAKGALMTTDNVKHAAEPYSYRSSQYHWQAPDVSKFRDRTFMGYKRKNGKVGTANYWLFIPTVFCENRNMDALRRRFTTNWDTP